MSTQCKTCNGSHFVHPEGNPELSMPCSECNSEWEKSPKVVYTDESLFPFGKHKDHDFGSIPDSYFLWLIDQPWIKDWPEVESYILKNFKDELA